MDLDIWRAAPHDAKRIAEIYMAAFESNELLQTQTSTDESRKAFQDAMEKKVLADINHQDATVLVAWTIYQDNPPKTLLATSTGTLDWSKVTDLGLTNAKIVAFATWYNTRSPWAYKEDPWWALPEDTPLHMLESWAKITEQAQKVVNSLEPCYKLGFLATDPSYTNLGAASLLMQWGKTECDAKIQPAYLETTMGTRSFFQKFGFEEFMPLSMEIGRRCGSENSLPQIYEERIMIYRPPGKFLYDSSSEDI